MATIPQADDGQPGVSIRQVEVLAPLRWIAAGWRDVLRAPGPSLAHGLLVAVGGWVIVALAWRTWYLLPGAFSGFVIVAPILATGLYELSRRIAAGEPARFADVLATWRRGTRPLISLGLGLALAATLWVLLSALLVALLVKGPVVGWEGFVRRIVLSEGSSLFWIWILAGGFGAALTFGATVVSTPLLLDRDIGLVDAVMTSIRAVGHNPVALALWATLIMVATALAMASFLAGFVLVIPVIGHASWHAYRDLVDAGALAPRR